MEIPDCWYRVSIKALVLNETKDKFLICQEEDGTWELPGGGLDFGTLPHEDLPREIDEEMGLKTTWIADRPSYFLTFHQDYIGRNVAGWRANIIYEATLEHLDFTPTDECVAIQFVGKEDVAGLDLRENITQLLEMFDPANHR